MARLGRSQPANWLTRAHSPSLAIPATATLAPALSLAAVAPVTGGASQGVVTNIGPAPTPPATGSLAAGVGLTAGGAITQDATLLVTTSVTAVPSAWLYIGAVPVTYLQYLGAGGTLVAEPGTPPGETLAFSSVPGRAIPGAATPGLAASTSPSPGSSGVVVEMEPASGWFYGLPVPPPDGRWITLGGGEMLAGPEEAEPDDLSWDPPAAMAHMPVPFDVIRRRIEAKQRGRVVV